jgi:hypothetical protein
VSKRCRDCGAESKRPAPHPGRCGESWRPAVGFEEFYEVSSEGRVRSLDRVVTDCLGRTRRQSGRMLKPSLVGDYLRIELRVRGSRHHLAVHRLVAFAFLPPPGVGQDEVRHLNCQALDNRARNLAWGTHSENVADTIEAGRYRNANSYKTLCANGHRYTHRNARGDRVCRTCHNENARRHREARVNAS